MSELPAGRELDALIASKVMGWLHVGRGITSFADATLLPFDHGRRDGSTPFEPVPPYSTDIRAAWAVVERVRHLSQESSTRLEHEGELWHATFSTLDFLAQASGETAPLAICRAALKAAENFR